MIILTRVKIISTETIQCTLKLEALLRVSAYSSVLHLTEVLLSIFSMVSAITMYLQDTFLQLSSSLEERQDTRFNAYMKISTTEDKKDSNIKITI